MTAPNANRTGGEIDAFCTKCAMNLGHTIIAMVGPKVVKVKCNTCGADHAYRGDQAPAPAKARAKSASAPRKAVPTWEERVKGANLAGARKYSPKETYQVNDVIAHPTFGVGVVTGNRSGKIDVLFKGFEKTLVAGKGG